MFKKISGLIFAWAVITGDGHLVPASANKPFYSDYEPCSSVARALGHGAVCREVDVPNSLISDNL